MVFLVFLVFIIKNGFHKWPTFDLSEGVKALASPKNRHFERSASILLNHNILWSGSAVLPPIYAVDRGEDHNI